MEFNELTDKVIGKIDIELGGNSARIKAIALLTNDNTVIKLSEYKLKSIFPPYGYVFEPGFFLNYQNKIGDIISFKIEENVKAENNKDKYKLKFGNPEIKNFGTNARRIHGFKRNGFEANLEAVSLDDSTDGTFYGITDKYIIGKLRTKNGKVEPALYHRIQMWDLDDDKLLSIDGKYRLIQEPQGESLVLDCMNEKQLFEWFREFLKQIQPDYVDLLDHNRSWRTELPKLFSTVDAEKLEADRIRLKRIEEKFDLIELSRTDIKTLVDSSENLKATFIKCLETHKEEFKENYRQELELYKSDIEKQKSTLDSEIKKLQNKKESEDNLLTKLTEIIKETKDELIKLKQNKDRIIQDFSIIKEVLQGQTPKNISINENSNSFIIEEIIHSDCENVSSLKEFEAQLMYRLSNNSLHPKLAKKIIDVISLYKAILIKDIRIGNALVEATGNAKFIVQQVEPDWIRFSNLWNNGLGEIWNSANNSPGTFHFLLLEDVNMSALECYCRPLLDVINGIRKKIPYGLTPFPVNLKILATIAPFNEPEIGLPIYKNTIEGWGAVGFRGNIKENIDSISQPEDKLLTTSLFFERIIDEFDKANIVNDVNAEIDYIFEA